MELLRGTAPEVVFYHPTADTTDVTAEYVVDGGSGVLATVTTNDDKSTFRLPYLQSQNDIEVTWLFSIGADDYTETHAYEVVTPYLTKQEILEIYPEATEQEVWEVEAAVRHIINAHTGQDFGYSVETLVVEGHGESALRLPKRLIEVTGLSTLSAELDIRAAIVTSDGWYLKKGWSHEVTPIESDSLYWGYTSVDNPAPGEPGFEKAGHGHIIVPPGSGSSPTPWRDDYPFKITGRWGYESVPVPVKQAAKLLVNDYACSEVAYRDRYLESIKAADWRLQFSSRAWESTGNVRADQLLNEYVLMDWAVV